MTVQWRLYGEEGPEPEQDRSMEHTKMYVDACLEVGEGYGGGVRVVDAWGVVVKAAGGTSSELLEELVP
jgi:hypothetical protein